MKRLTLTIAVMIALLTFAGSTLVSAQMGRYLVKIEGLRGPVQQAVVASGGKVAHVYDLIPQWIAVELPEQALEGLKRNPSVALIEEDSLAHALTQQLPWGVDRIDADLVHPYNKGTGVNVAILDTGLDYNHPDLSANYVSGHDYVNNDTDPMDDNGHGTFCAGIVAAVDNGIGYIGVAPEANLYAVKVLDSAGIGYYSHIIAGIQWAVNNGVQIISMSLGGNSGSQALQNACDAAYNAGCLLVAAAGNDYFALGQWEFDTVDYPARYSSVIAVGATDNTDTKASWSSTGPALELVAPGVNIPSTYWNDTYAIGSGTSAACPHVAGVAALVMAGEPILTNIDVRIRLQTTADDLGNPGKDNWYGFGLVDADEAAPPTGPSNQPPVASDDSYSTNEDIPLIVSAESGVLVNDNDPDGDSLTAMEVSGPSNGALTLNTDGSFTYTPDADFNGSDTFTYEANDGKGGTDTATVTITVNAVNDAPVAVNDSYSTDEDTVLNVAAPGVLSNDSDADGDTLTAVLTSDPSNGALTLNADGSFDYTPVVDFNGTDSFTYMANDSTANSNVATVTITVNPANYPPVAADDAYSTDEDTVLNVAAPGVLSNDSDVDGDTLTAVLATGVSNGTLTLNTDGSFTYTPNTGHTGTDSFTYKANDGQDDSNIATVTITVNPSTPTAHLTIDMSEKAVKKWWRVTAAVTVREGGESGALIQGAMVVGEWSGVYSGTVSGMTDAYGVVSFTTDRLANGGTVTFQVNRVVKNGQEYICAGETSDSIPGGPKSASAFVLGQSIPNPCNPDTWIPFAIPEDCAVTIRIYDVAGKLIRTLELGHLPAGVYADKEKAAYWDGRNESGETATSGIYFYSMEAGSFTAMKKLVVLK